MYNIPLIEGRELDALALKLGLKRKKVWWFIKEKDKSLRNRLEQRVFSICNSNLIPLNCKVSRGEF